MSKTPPLQPGTRPQPPPTSSENNRGVDALNHTYTNRTNTERPLPVKVPTAKQPDPVNIPEYTLSFKQRFDTASSKGIGYVIQLIASWVGLVDPPLLYKASQGDVFVLQEMHAQNLTKTSPEVQEVIQRIYGQANLKEDWARFKNKSPEEARRFLIHAEQIYADVEGLNHDFLNDIKGAKLQELDQIRQEAALKVFGHSAEEWNTTCLNLSGYPIDKDPTLLFNYYSQLEAAIAQVTQVDDAGSSALHTLKGTLLDTLQEIKGNVSQEFTRRREAIESKLEARALDAVEKRAQALKIDLSNVEGGFKEKRAALLSKIAEERDTLTNKRQEDIKTKNEKQQALDKDQNHLSSNTTTKQVRVKEKESALEEAEKIKKLKENENATKLTTSHTTFHQEHKDKMAKVEHIKQKISELNATLEDFEVQIQSVNSAYSEKLSAIPDQAESIANEKRNNVKKNIETTQNKISELEKRDKYLTDVRDGKVKEGKFIKTAVAFSEKHGAEWLEVEASLQEERAKLEGLKASLPTKASELFDIIASELKAKATAWKEEKISAIEALQQETKTQLTLLQKKLDEDTASASQTLKAKQTEHRQEIQRLAKELEGHHKRRVEEINKKYTDDITSLDTSKIKLEASIKKLKEELETLDSNIVQEEKRLKELEVDWNDTVHDTQLYSGLESEIEQLPRLMVLEDSFKKFIDAKSTQPPAEFITQFVNEHIETATQEGTEKMNIYGLPTDNVQKNIQKLYVHSPLNQEAEELQLSRFLQRPYHLS